MIYGLGGVVVDGQTVLTGSFNFTKAAEEASAENLLVIQDSALAAKYTTNWQPRAVTEHAPEKSGFGDPFHFSR